MSVLLPSKPVNLNISQNIIGNNNGNTATLGAGDSNIIIFDNGSPNTNMSFNINNQPAINISDTRRIGINIPVDPTKRLIINDELGESIRLSYNADKYCDINVDNNGALLLKPYNNEYINIISSTNDSGIKLNNIT
jgi:hypothetical protein